MRSSKAGKRLTKYRYLRNHNARKRIKCIRQKYSLSNWIISTIEGKLLPKAVTLSALIQPIVESNTSSNPRKTKEIVVESVASHSSTNAFTSYNTNKQKIAKKEAQQQQEPQQLLTCVKEKVSPPEHTESIANKSNKKEKHEDTGNNTDKQHKLTAEENGSTVIRADVVGIASKQNNGLTEELLVDVGPLQTTLTTNEPSLTKCSVDSGVDILEDHNLQQRSSSNSISNESSINDSFNHEDSNNDTARQPKQNEITKFSQNVAEFVSEVHEKFEGKVAVPQVMQHTVGSELHHVQKLESKPFIYKNDYSHLQKAMLTEIKPKQRKPRVNKLLPRDIEYCAHMMETYGEDYQKMTKDPKNIYMDDASGIARKIRIFRESPHYQEYLDSIKAQ